MNSEMLPRIERLFYSLPELNKNLMGAANDIELDIGKIIVFDSSSSVSNVLMIAKEDWVKVGVNLLEQAQSIAKKQSLTFEIRVPFEYLNRLQEPLIQLGFKHRYNFLGIFKRLGDDAEEVAPLNIEPFIVKNTQDRQDFVEIFAESFKYSTDEARKFCLGQIFTPSDERHNCVYLYRRPEISQPFAISQTVVFPEMPQIGYMRIQALRREARGKGYSRAVHMHCRSLLIDRGCSYVCSMAIQSPINDSWISTLGRSELTRFSVWTTQ